MNIWGSKDLLSDWRWRIDRLIHTDTKKEALEEGLLCSLSTSWLFKSVQWKMPVTSSRLSRHPSRWPAPDSLGAPVFVMRIFLEKGIGLTARTVACLHGSGHGGCSFVG